MNPDFEWFRMLFALALIAALFLFPIITLWRDERKKQSDPEG